MGCDGLSEDGLVEDIPHWSNSNRSMNPKAFLRLMRYHIDGCAGTNKSQYSLGGLALLLCLGVLDAINVALMVIGLPYSALTWSPVPSPVSSIELTTITRRCC